MGEQLTHPTTTCSARGLTPGVRRSPVARPAHTSSFSRPPISLSAGTRGGARLSISSHCSCIIPSDLVGRSGHLSSPRLAHQIDVTPRNTWLRQPAPRPVIGVLIRMYSPVGAAHHLKGFTRTCSCFIQL